ncbi:MAG: hypothetical protein PW792_15635 [Acidobacteriaceae bacterium]|nr:hypothetical protein [Acidobacteriaceae bacterium]
MGTNGAPAACYGGSLGIGLGLSIGTAGSVYSPRVALQSMAQTICGLVWRIR